MNYVAIDFGAESGRAMLARLDRGTLRLDEKHRFANPTGRLNGQLQWDILRQWEEVKTGLRACAASEPDLAGIGVDTWGVDFGLLDRDGALIGNPVMYRDARTDGIMDEVFRVVPAERIYAATGVQFMQFNTLFQLVAMQRQSPARLAAAERLLFMPDLFHWLLTGRATNEFSIASTSQMLDPTTGAWAVDLLDALGLPRKILGQLSPSGTRLGPLQQRLLDELHVGPVEVIAPASHDTASAVASVPADATGSGDWCYLSSGTWSLMGVELPRPLINAETRRLNFTNEGGVGGSTRLLKNIMGLWLVQECRRAFAADGFERSYAELTSLAAESEPFRSLIDPDHPPLLKPGHQPAKIAQFCELTKQPLPLSQGQFIRTCLDSLALTYRRTLDGLESLLGRRIGTIHIVGGGCQNELLNQLTADACGRTVVAGPVEATAIGNVLVQAIATGELPDLAAARRLVRESFSVKRFEPRDTVAADRAYARYRELLGN